jgi:hypothetical protein
MCPAHGGICSTEAEESGRTTGRCIQSKKNLKWIMPYVNSQEGLCSDVTLGVRFKVALGHLGEAEIAEITKA